MISFLFVVQGLQFGISKAESLCGSWDAVGCGKQNHMFVVGSVTQAAIILKSLLHCFQRFYVHHIPSCNLLCSVHLEVTSLHLLVSYIQKYIGLHFQNSFSRGGPHIFLSYIFFTYRLQLSACSRFPRHLPQLKIPPIFSIPFPCNEF